MLTQFRIRAAIIMSAATATGLALYGLLHGVLHVLGIPHPF